MPRRNRRAPSEPPRPPSSFSPHYLRELRQTAIEHLACHSRALDRAAADELPITGSECPTTGVRFLSVGQRPDEAAIRLSGAAMTSDEAARVLR